MTKPIFIKIDEYEDIKDILQLIRNKIGEAKDTLGKLHQLKFEEDTELEAWKAEIDEIEKRIGSIGKNAFGE
jgi:hypothetical protein